MGSTETEYTPGSFLKVIKEITDILENNSEKILNFPCIW